MPRSSSPPPPPFSSPPPPPPPLSSPASFPFPATTAQTATTPGPYPPATPHTTPQPPATPRTLHSSSDPEVVSTMSPPPSCGGGGPHPTSRSTATGTSTEEGALYDNDTKRGATPIVIGSGSPSSPTTRPGGLQADTPSQHTASSLRADWLAARAPEHFNATSSAHHYQQRLPAAADGELEPGWYREWEGRGREREAGRKRVCGLRLGVFWVVVLLLVLLLGGAIGGGVGGGLAASTATDTEVKESSTPTSASASTTTLSRAASPTASNQDSIDCPSRTGQYYTTTNGSLTFLQLCGMNICPETCDIMSASKERLESFEACMDACATYNRQIGTQKCVAVAWDYQQVRQSFDKLCWLKLSQAPLVKDDPQDGLTVGAVVVQS